MHDIAIDLTLAAIRIAKTVSDNTPRAHIVCVVAMELMKKTQCNEERAYLTAARALAEIEQPASAFVDVDNSTAAGVCLNIKGQRVFISTIQLMEMFAKQHEAEAATWQREIIAAQTKKIVH